MKKYNDVSTEDIMDEIIKPTNTQSLNNEFYFYNEINVESVFTLNKFLSDTQKQCMFQKIQFDLPKPPPIKIYINSDGGEIFSAFTSVDRIKSSKVPVNTYVEGIVASAASLISISGHKRFINKNAVMLVHQLRSWCGGTHENIKDEAKNLELLSDKIKKIYLENTKFKEKDLEEMLKHDIYLSAEECLKYGLVDVII